MKPKTSSSRHYLVSKVYEAVLSYGLELKCSVGSAKYFVNCTKYSLQKKEIIVVFNIQTTLRVVENFGGRVFSTTESFSTIESAQN